MKFLDLFSGIGGFRFGLEQAGHECVGYVEWDKYARKSYEAIHDTKGEWTAHDINEVRATDIPRSDIWTFGFPCTDISKAKSEGKGLSGASSGLFYTVMRLLEKTEDKPSYLFIENVADLLSINRGWDFASVILEMDKQGYDAEWKTINSKGWVPQNRERIYIVGHLRGKNTREVFPIERKGNSKLKQVATFDIKGMDAIKRIYDPEGICPTLTTMQGGHRQPKILLRDGRARKLTPKECWRLQGFPDWAFEKAQEKNSDSQLYKQAGNSVTVNVIYEIAKRMQGDAE